MPRLPLVADTKPREVSVTAPTITVDLCDALAMADPQVLTTLRRKQAEIENAIGAYEKRAKEARRDLSAKPSLR